MINLILYLIGGGVCALLGSLLNSLSASEPLLIGYDIGFYVIAGVFALLALVDLVIGIAARLILRRHRVVGHKRRRRR